MGGLSSRGMEGGCSAQLLFPTVPPDGGTLGRNRQPRATIPPGRTATKVAKVVVPPGGTPAEPRPVCVRLLMASHCPPDVCPRLKGSASPPPRSRTRGRSTPSGPKPGGSQGLPRWHRFRDPVWEGCSATPPSQIFIHLLPDGNAPLQLNCTIGPFFVSCPREHAMCQQHPRFPSAGRGLGVGRPVRARLAACHCGEWGGWTRDFHTSPRRGQPTVALTP